MTQRTTQTADDSASLEEQVRMRIESLAYLPTTVGVAMRFIQLGKDPDAEPNEYARVISSDSSLCSKLLALANSSWFGVRNRITKPQMAVNLLGLGTVRTLSISYCLTGLHNELRLAPEESRMFWTGSLCKAVAAKHFAQHVDPTLAEDAFAAGLFQDFALPIMFSVARQQFLPALEDASIAIKAHLEQQRSMFHLDHAEIGRIVAQKLELPEMFVDAVAFHHNHDQLTQFIEDPVIADAVYAASLFPHLLNAWNRQDVDKLRQFIAARTARNLLDFSAYLDAVQEEYNQLYSYFETEQSAQLKLAELLEVATHEAADHTTHLVGAVHELLQEAAFAGKQIHQILSNQTRLEQAASHDPLTGALNRDGFARSGARILAEANRYGTGFCLAYMDIDHFKTLNDTLGHPTGDVALRKLVEIAREGLRPTDCLGRLGGDEFAILMPDCARAQAIQIVQKLLSRIASTPMGKGTDPNARITLSAGLVCHPPRSPLMTLDTLLSAADKLMYQSKRAGGNCLTHGPESTPMAA